MKRIFFFGFTNFADRMRASSLCHELKSSGYEPYIIEQPCYVLQIGEIVFSPEVEVFTDLADEKLPEPFILFCGMSGEVLDTALNICNGHTLEVLTPSNSMMTVYELSENILAEKRSIEGKR